MRKIYIYLFFIISTSISAQEQAQLAEPFFNDDETSTARSMGLAGAFGAIGADLSSATHNPAGIAVFRKKEIGLGLAYNQQINNIAFLGNENQVNESVFRLNNIGYVYSNLQTEWIGDSIAVKRNGLVSWALTAGMNQKSELNEVINYEGFNSNNSLLSSYVEYANNFAGTSLNNLSVFEKQALDVDLLDYTESGGNYNYFSEIENGNVLQSGNEFRQGARRDFYLGGGLNFSNKLYLGATIGIPWMKYSFTDRYFEEDSENIHTDFNSMSFINEDKFSGVGGYLGVGAIYRFTDYVRAGLHIKSPTVLELNRESRLSTSSNLNSSGVSATGNEYQSTFALTLPWKAGLQLVASHPKYGLISLEGDYVDYQSTRIKYSNEDGDFTENDEQFKNSVDQYYGGSLNFRGGIEARVYRDFRFRAGYGYQGSPYENKEDELGADYSQTTCGLGFGYRFVPANIVIDIGYNFKKQGEWDADYLYNNQANSILKDQQSHQIKLSIGKRFNN